MSTDERMLPFSKHSPLYVEASLYQGEHALVTGSSIKCPSPHVALHVLQNPEDWWNGLGDAVRQAVSESGVPPAEIVALGLDTTCCSVVALDKTVSTPLCKQSVPFVAPCIARWLTDRDKRQKDARSSPMGLRTQACSEHPIASMSTLAAWVT